MDLLDYFIKYVKVDTQSDDSSNSIPSSKKQLDLSKILHEDLKALGVETFIDEFGQVYGFLKGEENLETIGLNAHIDTALELSDKNVHPQIVFPYNGEDIELNKEISLKVSDFPFLKDFIGKTLITTDGTTLLGADDKAGLAIIMSLIEFYQKNPKIKHHPISILFTVDEEIGRGADHFDNSIFKADYCFSLDGSSPFSVNFENFNAAHADLVVNGVSIHPGEAKDKMVNASNVLIHFDSLLPKDEIPSKTSLYEGFHHLISISSSVDYGEAHYIIRDHDEEKLNQKIKLFEKAAIDIQKIYKTAKINLDIQKDYKNMKTIFDKDRRALTKIEKAYEQLHIPLTYTPIRGGTDGATFSFKGCPTPNLGTGSYNHHGRYEFFVLEEAKLLVEILKTITKA